MDSPLIKAQHYFDQAQKMRELASEEADEKSRRDLLETAESYERLSAKFLEKGAVALKRLT